MYRNLSSSPIFDAPEFPTLRRVKPLPKRRRTSLNGSILGPESIDTTASPTVDANAGGAPEGMLVGENNSVPHSLHMAGLPPLSLPGPDATAEELLAHAESLQSYYLPILDAAAANISSMEATLAGDPGASATDSAPTAASGGGGASPGADTLDPNMHASAPYDGVGVGIAGLGISNQSLRDRDEESEHGDGDYVDHLQQPGNTKKRKVPANTLRMQGARHDSASGPEGEGEQESLEHDGTLTVGIPTGGEVGGDGNDMGGGGQGDPGGTEGGPVSALRLLARRNTRLSQVTLAGMQQKETLKVRKRQLAAVLGALSHGDTMALDQALSGRYPFPMSGSASGGSGDGSADALSIEGGKTPPKIRLSKRMSVRKARKPKIGGPLLLKDVGKENEEPVHVPEGDFTFVCHSATTERLITTKQEVATLRRRFETELARQASAAASIVAANKAVASSANKSSRQRRHDKAQQRARATGGISDSRKSRDQSTDRIGQLSTASNGTPQLQNANSKSRGKKKKRSALANASNPHHLRNYVPSRLPSGGGPPNGAGAHQGGNANDLGPFPLRFLSAEIPPRRRKQGRSRERGKTQKAQQESSLPLTNPAEEWVCVFCEYELFFGEDGDYRKAVRKRKQILKRRRRARERAAAAASGTKMGTAKRRDSEDESEDEDGDVGYDPVPAGSQTGGNGMQPKQSKWRGDNRERGAGGEHG